MPAYDYYCECGWADELYPSIEQRDSQTCPDCGAPLRRGIGAAVPTGIMPSKPIVSEQLGRTFETNAQLRAFCKERNLEMESPSSKSWRDRTDGVQAKADAAAKRMGYRDAEHRGRVRRIERARERGET